MQFLVRVAAGVQDEVVAVTWVVCPSRGGVVGVLLDGLEGLADDRCDVEVADEQQEGGCPWCRAR